MVEGQKTVYNFSAGPCCLPKEVLKRAQDELMDWHGTGISVMEMSHRSKAFVEIAEGCKTELKKLLSIPDNFTIFLMQGGASLQFAAVPLNLFKDDAAATKSANYVTTGTWSQGAIKECKKYGTPNEVCDNKPGNYTGVPEEWNVAEGATYFHYCDNETIQGVEFNEFPFEKVPEGQILVSDMSSNFCSKPIDWSKFGVVYAGAQKNVGPAGLCFVVVRNDLIPGHSAVTPLMCDWETFGKAPNTLHNTPACWPIYMCGLNLAYMNEKGGLAAMQEACRARSELLYSFIDGSDGYYTNKVAPKYRSRLNVPFRVCENDEMEAKFLKEAAAKNLIELKGHRSIGGCRASLYNAMPLEGVQALTAFMAEFKAANPKQ